MKKHVLTSLSVAVAIAVLPVATWAAAVNPALAGLSPTEALRVTQVVNARDVTALSDTHLALLDNLIPTAIVPDSFRMNHMHLVLA
ncbi:MAG: hypothetical protein ACREP0_06040, partial [Rhodanobacteraceae bacterium]